MLVYPNVFLARAINELGLDVIFFKCAEKMCWNRLYIDIVILILIRRGEVAKAVTTFGMNYIFNYTF